METHGEAPAVFDGGSEDRLTQHDEFLERLDNRRRVVRVGVQIGRARIAQGGRPLTEAAQPTDLEAIRFLAERRVSPVAAEILLRPEH